MLKIRGNKEFIQWWEHWMSRLHSNRSGPATTSSARPSRESGHNDKHAEDNLRETPTPRNLDKPRFFSETP